MTQKNNYENIEGLKSSIKDISDRQQQVRIVAEYILNHLKANSITKSKSSSEIWDEFEKIKSEFDFLPDIPKNTFVVNLSKVSNAQDSKINCPGKKQGYYLEQLVQKLEELEKNEPTNEAQHTIEQVSETKESFQEKDIYPILKDWLFEKDFDKVADTSALRANGKWGNPDLVGLKIEDIYGRPEIEISTIEVKLTDDNWEQWIFEAVAHTRFSNRSYFCFLYPENLFNKLDSTDLKLYAEHFGVGILIIEIDGNDYLKVKEKKSVKINTEKLRIIEYCQAPFTSVNIKFRKKFLKSLDILDLNKLYKFGEELR